MKFLHDIVCELNERYKAILPKNAKLAPVCSSLLKKGKGKAGDKILPSYVNDEGEATYVGPDDNFDVIIYHKAGRISKNRRSGYGNQTYEILTAGMSMYVFGRRDKIKTSADETTLALSVAMPEKVSDALLQNLGFNAVSLKMTEANINTQQVFKEEFPKDEFFLKPEQFFIKINYTIEVTYLKGCFDLC